KVRSSRFGAGRAIRFFLPSRRTHRLISLFVASRAHGTPDRFPADWARPATELRRAESLLRAAPSAQWLDARNVSPGRQWYRCSAKRPDCADYNRSEAASNVLLEKWRATAKSLAAQRLLHPPFLFHRA